MYTNHHMSSKLRTTLQTECMQNCQILSIQQLKKKKLISVFSNVIQSVLVVWNSQKNQETPNKRGHNSEVKPETSFKKLEEQCYVNDPDQWTVSIADCDRKQGIYGHTEVRKALSQHWATSHMLGSRIPPQQAAFPFYCFASLWQESEQNQVQQVGCCLSWTHSTMDILDRSTNTLSKN